MNYNSIGNSGLSISNIGFGCMSLLHNQKENERIIHHAIANGINYFDTADIYEDGMNEIAVGLALKQCRQNVLLATKVGNEPKAGGGWNWNASKDYILKAVDLSLKRLKTDYIDICQLHGGTIEDRIDETIEAFELLQKQGKIRFYGISSIRPNVINQYVMKSQMVTTMMQYSLLDRRPEENCLSMLQNNHIGVLARGCLAGGLLVNKPAKSYLGYSEQEVKKAADAIKDISGRDRTPSQTAIGFVLANNAISSAIIGVRTWDQLEDIISLFHAPSLTKEAFQMLSGILEPNKYTQHI